MKTPAIVISAAALALGSCAMGPTYGPGYGPAYGPTAGPVGVPVGPATTLTTANKAPFGTYLVDGAGRAVYVLDGTRGSSARMACGYDCARVWPPVMAGGPPRAGAGLDPRRIGTAPRGSGMQLTYHGWPLFYYVRDRGPGETTGQNVHDQWGGWYLLSPNGESIRPY